MNLNVKAKICRVTRSHVNGYILKADNLHNVEVDVLDCHDDIIDHLSKNPCDLFVVDQRADRETIKALQEFVNQSFYLKKVVLLSHSEIQKNDMGRALDELSAMTQLENQCVFNRLSLLNKEVGPALTRLLIEMFISKMNNYVDNFESLVNTKNPNEICFEAHNLKSASANLGFKQISRPCSYLEKGIANCDEKTARVLLAEVIFQYAKASSFLSTYLKKSS